MKFELLRVVASDRGAGLEVVPDPAGRAPGRGAHLHPTPECLELAIRRRAFPRALKTEGSGGRLPTTAVQDHITKQHEEQMRNDRSELTRNWSSSS
jgi:predicted RNA-binding protein YlxR (DUF448 family)